MRKAGLVLAVLALAALARADMALYCERNFDGNACEAYAAGGFMVSPFLWPEESRRCQDFEACCADDAMWAKVDTIIRIEELEQQHEDCNDRCEMFDTACYDSCEIYYDQARDLEDSTVANDQWMGMDALCVYTILTANCCPTQFADYESSCSAAMGRPLASCSRGAIAGPVCGNGYCEEGETESNCPQDCVTVTDEDCANERDDDGDSLIDCRDSDCFEHPYCMDVTMTMKVTPQSLNLDAEQVTEFWVEFRLIKEDGNPLEGARIDLTLDDPDFLASQWGVLTDHVYTDAGGFATHKYRLRPLKDALSIIEYPTQLTLTAEARKVGMGWSETQTKVITVGSAGLPPKIVSLDYWLASGERRQQDDEYAMAIFPDRRYVVSVGVDDDDQGSRDFKYRILVCDGALTYEGRTSQEIISFSTMFSDLLLDWRTARGVNKQDLEFMRTLWDQTKSAAKSGAINVGASTVSAITEGTIVGIPAARVIKGVADAKGVYDGVKATIDEERKMGSNLKRGHYTASALRFLNAKLEGAQTTVGAISIVAKNILPPVIKNAGDFTMDAGNFVFDLTQGGVSALAAKAEAWDLEKKVMDCPVVVRVEDADGNTDIRRLLPYYIYWT